MGCRKVDNRPAKLLAWPVMSADLYSLRMRAEEAGGHCCGAERIVPAGELPAATAELVARALAGGARSADAVHCTIERLAGAVPRRPLPAVSTFEVAGHRPGRTCAAALLQRAGVAARAAETAIALLAAGPAPGGRVMRGAMIIDALSGERLEADPARGVRVSRMDLAPETRASVLAALAAAGLAHHRVAEALALSGKVLRAPGLVAELCWSDDPDYLTGYVAEPRRGYQRITRLKAAGDAHGGRALFVSRKGWNPQDFVSYLEREPVLFDVPGTVSPPVPWEG